MSQVVKSGGREFVNPKATCLLCGSTHGLKIPCAGENCCFDEGKAAQFHATCARQAGFEVKDDASLDSLFYGTRFLEIVDVIVLVFVILFVLIVLGAVGAHFMMC